jgi:[pyruvate, water dikinase]-phosphate phosphotransferase / [pyruvate, water dikinase] kinase
MLTIYVVSDATGETAERMLRSALVQFKNAPVTVIRRGKIRTPRQVRELVEQAASQKSLIVHTLVSYDLRWLMLAESRSHSVDSMDLVGPVLDRLVSHLRLMPRQRPGLLKQLVEAKSREIEAVEFAFRHDDGQRVEELKEAEVVLVGISRTMKTPIMLYLAYRGWFAANVPIILGIALPRELLRLPARRVFCLVMTPDRLLELRRTRADAFNIPEEPYASQTHIRQELIHARRLCRDYGWRQIEVTGKSVEEAARQIIMLLSAKNPKSGPAW